LVFLGKNNPTIGDGRCGNGKKNPGPGSLRLKIGPRPDSLRPKVHVSEVNVLKGPRGTGEKLEGTTKNKEGCETGKMRYGIAGTPLQWLEGEWLKGIGQNTKEGKYVPRVITGKGTAQETKTAKSWIGVQGGGKSSGLK